MELHSYAVEATHLRREHGSYVEPHYPTPPLGAPNAELLTLCSLPTQMELQSMAVEATHLRAKLSVVSETSLLNHAPLGASNVLLLTLYLLLAHLLTQMELQSMAVVTMHLHP